MHNQGKPRAQLPAHASAESIPPPDCPLMTTPSGQRYNPDPCPQGSGRGGDLTGSLEADPEQRGACREKDKWMAPTKASMTEKRHRLEPVSWSPTPIPPMSRRRGFKPPAGYQFTYAYPRSSGRRSKVAYRAEGERIGTSAAAATTPAARKHDGNGRRRSSRGPDATRAAVAKILLREWNGQGRSGLGSRSGTTRRKTPLDAIWDKARRGALRRDGR